MELPSSVRRQAFIESLKQGTVFRLKGSKPFESDSYHIFIVLNYDPSADILTYLVNGTSQVEKRKAALYAMSIDVENTTVTFAPNQYCFFPKETLVNCNSVHNLDVNLIDFSSDDIMYVDGELCDKDVQRIVKGVQHSRLVPPYIKQRLLPPENN